MVNYQRACAFLPRRDRVEMVSMLVRRRLESGLGENWAAWSGSSTRCRWSSWDRVLQAGAINCVTPKNVL